MTIPASRFIQTLFCASVLLASAARAAEPSVSFTAPMDGAVVSSPFDVRFAVTGMEVKPAGDMTPNTGHHHLLINAGPIPKGVVIPADDTHLHYGKGQTGAKVTLPPGKYQLTMQFADGAHQSYGPAMSKTINITVK
ncbi:DUF4399 domain-containing protein [Herbaspirillum sp. RV1423]|uniref:DUF4399 domain-containing protein n=1 Tax=Herbaspirillum sp. RV1423 TaxID=1443993 RepID=UPI0006856F70|nr:DUF4399 domain-containing protein [Herbaspirillum sp. RV1423]